ncbi:MAG: hypothetical protein M3R72_03350 [Bacteroidota bacterium]|nr:hypothetical protein [Bacteroidota bacterium]
MKRFLFTAFTASVALISCYKDAGHGYRDSRNIIIDTTLASGMQYQLNLASYGDADDSAAIRTQATNFATSEIANAGFGFAPIYHFSAAANAKTSLSEQVVITVTEGAHGQPHPHNDSTIITINFKIQ